MVGEMSHRENILVGKCPVGEASVGEVSSREIVLSGKCPLGEVSVGELSSLETVLQSMWVLESIHKFIIELYALQSLFVRGSSKQQRRCRIISNFKKQQTFSSFTTTKCYSGQSHNVAPLLAPHKKGLPLFFSLPRREIPRHSVEKRSY